MGGGLHAKDAVRAHNFQYMWAFGQRQCGNIADWALA